MSAEVVYAFCLLVIVDSLLTMWLQDILHGWED